MANAYVNDYVDDYVADYVDDYVDDHVDDYVDDYVDDHVDDYVAADHVDNIPDTNGNRRKQLIELCKDRTCDHVCPNKNHTLMYSLDFETVEIVKQTLEYNWGPQCPGDVLSEIHHLMLNEQSPDIIKQKINLVIEYKRCDVTRRVQDIFNDKYNYSTLEFAIALFHGEISDNRCHKYGEINKLYDIIPILIRHYSPTALIGECTNISNIPISIDTKTKSEHHHLCVCYHMHCECGNYSGLFNDFKQYVLKVKHNKLFCWLRTLVDTYFEIIPLDILHVIAEY